MRLAFLALTFGLILVATESVAADLRAGFGTRDTRHYNTCYPSHPPYLNDFETRLFSALSP
ncbi:MAG: hypothetical protein RLN89_03960 [Parvibaculum sp.]